MAGAAERERRAVDDDAQADFLILSDDALSGLGVSTREVVAALEAAIRAQAAGALWSAPKSALLPGDGRCMTTSLAASDSPGITAVKSVMVSPRNPARGLNGVELVISDACLGLVESVAEFYPEALWQRCVVHCLAVPTVGEVEQIAVYRVHNPRIGEAIENADIVCVADQLRVSMGPP